MYDVNNLRLYKIIIKITKCYKTKNGVGNIISHEIILSWKSCISFSPVCRDTRREIKYLARKGWANVATNTFYEHGSLVRSSVRPFVRFWLARDIANDELRTTNGGWGKSKSSQQPPPGRYHYSFSPTTTNNCPAAAQEDTVSYHLLIRSFLLLLQPKSYPTPKHVLFLFPFPSSSFPCQRSLLSLNGRRDFPFLSLFFFFLQQQQHSTCDWTRSFRSNATSFYFYFFILPLPQLLVSSSSTLTGKNQQTETD